MMRHAIAIEEMSGQNLHIWPSMMWFSALALLGWLGFGFNVIALHPWIITSYDIFKQIWIVIERCQLLLISMWCCFCSKFSNFGTICAVTLFILKASVKIAWHELSDMATSSATSLILTISQNHFLYCLNVFMGCWRAPATRTSIIIKIFSVFLELQLVFCS